LSANNVLQRRLAGLIGWQMLAISVVRSIDVFGEWDGFSLWPLSTLAEGQLAQLQVPAA
jgi:hypothetical protein